MSRPTSSPTALWVVPVSELAGVARHVLDVARAGLPGWRLVVAAPEGPLLERLRMLGTDVVPIATGFGTAASLQTLRATVRRIGPQIVHSHLAKADLFVAAATLGQPVKLISTEHHISPDRYMFHPNHTEARIMEAAHHARLTRFSRVIAVSASTRRDMIARWRTRTPITVILNGVDRPDPAPVREPGLRFLSLTRLAAEKNVEMTLRVFALIAAEHPAARLTIAGAGSELSRLQEMAEDLGVAEAVTFPGFVEAGQAMASHDVILQPSRSDNCSYTLLDAAAQGMGVAASPTGGNPEILPMRCIAALDDDAAFARIAVEQGLDLEARPVLGTQIPTVAGMTEQIIGEYDAALGTETAACGRTVGDTDTTRPESDNTSHDIPEASVIIAYYKAADLLPSQLNALAQQAEPLSFEVIIADNEGSAQLPSVIAPFQDLLNIRVLDATGRRGRCAARNDGAVRARGKFLAFCDDDDVVSPGWLTALTEVLRERDVLATGPLRLDRVNSEKAWRTTVGAAHRTDFESPVLQYPFTYLGYLPFAYGCNIGMRRSTFLELGGFEEGFLRGDEDVDLSWRAAEHGVEMYVEPGAIVDFRLRPTPAGVRHQRHNYQRSQVDMWARSMRMGRPVSGMSLRWTLARTAELPVKRVRLIGATEAEKYAFASHAGDIMGNLHGQWEQRVWPLLVDHFSLISHRDRQ
ncbi:MAG: glycosyltransferase [Acidipropionibacterium acidipropionici]|nr:glycosyltransferase [Acidipropionibacterium acidipropionici]